MASQHEGGGLYDKHILAAPGSAEDPEMEDRSNAKRSKNNLAIIRKFAYNILQIAILQERKEPGITTMRDLFTDDLTLIEKYVFQGIGRLG